MDRFHVFRLFRVAYFSQLSHLGGKIYIHRIILRLQTLVYRLFYMMTIDTDNVVVSLSALLVMKRFYMYVFYFLLLHLCCS